jgi:hypothetical protein
MAAKPGNRLKTPPKAGRIVIVQRKFTRLGKGNRIRGRLRRGRV